MLQYGKPINKDIKSIDLKIECPCLSLAIAPVLRRLLPVSGGGRAMRWPKREREAAF
jgi:hypothetical protein